MCELNDYRQIRACVNSLRAADADLRRVLLHVHVPHPANDDDDRQLLPVLSHNQFQVISAISDTTRKCLCHREIYSTAFPVLILRNHQTILFSCAFSGGFPSCMLLGFSTTGTLARRGAESMRKIPTWGPHVYCISGSRLSPSVRPTVRPSRCQEMFENIHSP